MKKATKEHQMATTKQSKNNLEPKMRFMSLHSIMKKRIYQLFGALFFLILVLGLFGVLSSKSNSPQEPKKDPYWLLLHRKSQVEFLYQGIPGDKSKSKLVKTFRVKSGIAGQRPTPLPQLLGRKYWNITGKVETKDSEETAPYFLILDIPYSEEYPFGPTPYLECVGPDGVQNQQCDWILPGSFGLHGINGDPSRLAAENPGSSGCVRHKDEDITYLYNLFDPEKEKIRYYIEDI